MVGSFAVDALVLECRGIQSEGVKVAAEALGLNKG